MVNSIKARARSLNADEMLTSSSRRSEDDSNINNNGKYVAVGGDDRGEKVQENVVITGPLPDLSRLRK